MTTPDILFPALSTHRPLPTVVQGAEAAGGGSGGGEGGGGEGDDETEAVPPYFLHIQAVSLPAFWPGSSPLAEPATHVKPESFGFAVREVKIAQILFKALLD